MESKDIKTQTLDLGKTLSYLLELSKTNNQPYVTPEGIALLEGICLAGNGKVKVVLEEQVKRIPKTPQKRSWF